MELAGGKKPAGQVKEKATSKPEPPAGAPAKPSGPPKKTAAAAAAKVNDRQPGFLNSFL